MNKTIRFGAVLLTCSVLVAVVPPAIGASPKRAALVQTLLERGQQALDRGQLTQPTYDNAYDHFTATLLLDPDNAAAKQGLQTVLLQYTGLIEQQLRAGRLQTARELLSRALQYYPGQARLLELQASMESAEQAQARAAPTTPDEEGRIDLPIQELNARGEAIRTRLARIAQTLRDSDASVLIFARTDAEGRYIYSLMKAAVPGYLIRGDIRIHPRPHLQLKEPL